MSQASAVLRQSHATLSAGIAVVAAASGAGSSASGSSAAAAWKLKRSLEQDVGAFISSAASAAFYSHSAGAGSASGSSGQRASARKTIPPHFFQSSTPFLRSGSGDDALAVPELEPFSLASQVALRQELLDSLAQLDSERSKKRVWDAYHALAHAPTAEGDAPSPTIVNLLPYVGLDVHREVLRTLVDERLAMRALAQVRRRRAELNAAHSDVPGVSYRFSPSRPPRRRHLSWIEVGAGGQEMARRAPFVLEQMVLACETQGPISSPAATSTPTPTPAARNDICEHNESTQRTRCSDFNLVLSTLADKGNVVPLSKVWCMFTDSAARGLCPPPNMQSYAIVVRGLYVHLQHQLYWTRVEVGAQLGNAGKAKAFAKVQGAKSGRAGGSRKKVQVVLKQPLEHALFTSVPTDTIDSIIGKEGDEGGLSISVPASLVSRRERTSIGKEYPGARATSLAITRLKTVLETLDMSAPRGFFPARRWKETFWRRQMVDYALRVLRLGGDLQGMAVLIQREFGYRLGHPDILEPETDGERHSAMTIHTLNTVIMALGEHAKATDMVVAYESLTRPLPSALPTERSAGMQRGRWQTIADDEEDEGLLGLTSGETKRGKEGQEDENAQAGNNLFKLDWSALSFRQDAEGTTTAEASASSQASLDAHTSTPEGPGSQYAIHPSTTTLRTLVRNMCHPSRPVVHSYATLSKTPMPRGDWTARSLRADVTPLQAQRMTAALLAEDHRRAHGHYILLALAYLREGVEAYARAVERMQAAVQPQDLPSSDGGGGGGGSNPDGAAAQRRKWLEPPVLVPTAACFRPAVAAARQQRKPQWLRELRGLVLESAALMERERAMLADAIGRWSDELARVFDRAPPPPARSPLRSRPGERQVGSSKGSGNKSDSTLEELQRREWRIQRRTALTELLWAARRQSELVQAEEDALRALVYGSPGTPAGAAVRAEDDVARAATVEDDGEEYDGFAARRLDADEDGAYDDDDDDAAHDAAERTSRGSRRGSDLIANSVERRLVETGGINALLQRITTRRRKRQKRRLDAHVAERKREAAAEAARVAQAEASAARRARRQSGVGPGPGPGMLAAAAVADQGMERGSEAAVQPPPPPPP